MLDELTNIKIGDYAADGNIPHSREKKVLIMPTHRKETTAIQGGPIGILPATFQVSPNELATVTYSLSISTCSSFSRACIISFCN
jgi:hypothetical protein